MLLCCTFIRLMRDIIHVVPLDHSTISGFSSKALHRRRRKKTLCIAWFLLGALYRSVVLICYEALDIDIDVGLVDLRGDKRKLCLAVLDI